MWVFVNKKGPNLATGARAIPGPTARQSVAWNPVLRSVATQCQYPQPARTRVSAWSV